MHLTTPENTQLDHLNESVDNFNILEDPIEVWDRGYINYARFLRKTLGGDDFVTTLKIGETGEFFRPLTLKDPSDEVTEYLTTLLTAEYDPNNVVSIYTLRTLIERFFRESKQYTNVENVHSTTLNGVLFELFSTLIEYLLVDLYE